MYSSMAVFVSDIDACQLEELFYQKSPMQRKSPSGALRSKVAWSTSPRYGLGVKRKMLRRRAAGRLMFVTMKPRADRFPWNAI